MSVVSTAESPFSIAVMLQKLTSRWGRMESLALGLAGLVLLVLLWELSAKFNWVNNLYLPPPLSVWDALVNLFTTGTIWPSFWVSGQEFLIGFAISVVGGGTVGILAGWYRRFGAFIHPIVVGINSMPQLALIPVMILVFGVGIESKVILVILSCAVTMILNTETGVENVEPQIMRMGRSFGATDFQTIRTVVVPSVVPYFMTGVRISVGRALVAVVVAEFYASQIGLGNILIKAANSYQTSTMYAMIVFLTFLGIVLTQGARAVELRLQRWKG